MLEKFCEFIIFNPATKKNHGFPKENKIDPRRGGSRTVHQYQTGDFSFQGRHRGLPLRYIRDIINSIIQWCRERKFSFHIRRGEWHSPEKIRHSFVQLVMLLALSSLLLCGCCGSLEDFRGYAPPQRASESKEEQLSKILEQHKLWLESKGKEGKRADLSHKYIGKVTLRGAVFDEADLSMVDFSYAELDEASFKSADLQYAKLHDASLEDANFTWAKLQYAELDGANLEGANFRDADLRNASLRGASLRWADFSWARLEGADFSGADLTYTNLRHVRIDGANFTGAKMEKAWLK